VGGVPAAVDRNVFYGGEKEWALFLMTGCDPRAINALSSSGRCRVQN
jgi:lysozyme